ncbi:MAG TPA: tetratricopeptide repeat protein [Candidatus Polarisedimenticolaceae bacterium]|nr:tetratricopeptide repeat protein [Candidatus Polarisedimenticolaceae bacterium]
MARISRKELKRDEFIEATKEAENWLEENWRLVLRIAGGVVVVGLLVGGWFWYGSLSRRQAAGLLQDGLAAYQTAQEAGFVDATALDTALGKFERAARKGGGSPVGLVAEYYRGVALHRLGRSEESIDSLGEVAVSAGAPASLRGSASAVLAEVYAATGEQDRAVAMLESLIAAEPPTYPIDQALLALAELHERSGDTDRARQLWQRIVDEYPARGAADEARQRLGS